MLLRRGTLIFFVEHFQSSAFFWALTDLSTVIYVNLWSLIPGERHSRLVTIFPFFFFLFTIFFLHFPHFRPSYFCFFLPSFCYFATVATLRLLLLFALSVTFPCFLHFHLSYISFFDVFVYRAGEYIDRVHPACAGSKFREQLYPGDILFLIPIC